MLRTPPPDRCAIFPPHEEEGYRRRMTLISDIADIALAIGRPHPVRIAVEGRSAAGKSIFADALAAALRRSGRQVVRAGIDDFHPPGHAARSRAGRYTPQSLYDEGFDYAAFRRLLLAPLGPDGDRRVRLALHDSLNDRPIEAAEATVDADALVVVDGAFLLRPDLRDAWDLAIWLDISFETMIRRAVARDVAWQPDPAEIRRGYLERWQPTHALYEATGARDLAHVVIDNEDPLAPRLVRMAPTA